MTAATLNLVDSEVSARAEMLRTTHEASNTEDWCRVLRLALDELVRREQALLHELERAASSAGRRDRSLGDIAVDLGAVRTGIGELERMVREAERRRTALQRRASDLMLATSMGSRD